ncbi:SOS response-associated peptidase [Marinobacter sp. X15-166B]|uniref:SOS response-associated peptidase n=1 Tax=Marinobacter sp. X15-166B TaxID=1897620 RepID=UPI001D171657|nr:SOS response-associated peptidase [Marinobacter sp. X15-166B]
MLSPEDFDRWLDPQLTNTDPLQHLFETRIRQPLLVEPVRSPLNLEPVGAIEEIAADNQ